MTPVLRPGVHAVMVTPFLPDEAIDKTSLARLVDAFAAAECQGVLALGVMGEADRLSDAERDRVIAATVAHASNRLQVTVGVTHQSTVVTADRARKAEEAGAAAVMVAPPVGSVAGPELKAHFARVAANLTIPIVIQDHPASSGVKLPVAFLADLATVVPPGSSIKLEDPPAPTKIAKLLSVTQEIQVLGGLGGMSLVDELDAGASGVMTGFADPRALVEIVRLHQAGDRPGARALHTSVLPLMVLESQPGLGVGLRKELLVRRGLIAHATVRQPATSPDPYTLQIVDTLLATIDPSSSFEKDDDAS